jgi:RNA polymerase sigma-70 factor (ECF subfamily)
MDHFSAASPELGSEWGYTPPQPEGKGALVSSVEGEQRLDFDSSSRTEQHADRAPADPAVSMGSFEKEAMPHLNDLYRTAARILGDRSRAEDVVQEVYLQAWKSYHRFQPGTNCKAWLYKILFHSINHYRRKWFQIPTLKTTQEFLEAALTYTEPMPENLTDGEILAALDRIPAEYKSVVLLADVEEFAYKEIAEILAVPIGTVMSRLSRGRKLLRDKLAEVAKGYGIGRSAEGGTR